MSKKIFILVFLLIIQICLADLEYPPYGNEDWNKNTIGNHKVLVVIANFNDFKNLTTIDEIQKNLNLLKEFYYNNSYKKLNLSFDIKSVNLSRNMEYYGEDGGFGNTSWKRIDELGYKYHHYGEDFSYQDVLANDILKILDNNINFLDYDHIIFIHSYYDQAEEQNCTNCLWSVYIPYINFASNDNTYVNYGILVSEKANFGVIAHEFGHELGLPDLYNIETGKQVIGEYCIMDYGVWTNENFGAFSKYKLKFSNPVEVNETSTTVNFTLNLSNSEDSFLKINVDNWTYFLIEYRRMNYGKNVLLIWEVKEDVANNTDKDNLMVNVYNFSENSTFKKYNTTINFSLFENFSIVNIENKFYKRNISRFINVDFCTSNENINIQIWGKNFSWCDERNTKKENFLNNESFYALIKLNVDRGDNVSVIFKDINLSIIENLTYENLDLQRGNAYNIWNNYIDNIIATLNISNLIGKYIMEIYVNGVKIYEKNLTVLNSSNEITPIINFSIKSHYYSNTAEIKIENSGANMSEIWIDYWNKDFCNLKECHKKYTMEEEKVSSLNNNRSINLTFYGNFGKEYCFQVYGSNVYKINKTEISCTKLCKKDLNLAMEILYSIDEKNNDICYDFNYDNGVDVFDASELLESLSFG